MSKLRRCSMVFAPSSIDALVGTGSDFHSHAIPLSRSNRTVLLSCSFSWGDAGSHSPLERGIQSNTCFLTFLNILDIRWIFVVYSSDLRWVFIGFSLDLPWIFAGPSLDLPWIFVGSLLDLPWIFVGPSLDLPWIFVGSLLGLPWIFVGSVLDLPWIFVGSSLGIHWIYIYIYV